MEMYSTTIVNLAKLAAFLVHITNHFVLLANLKEATIISSPRLPTAV